MAASIELSDLVSDLEISLNTPGADIYSNVSEDEWISRLRQSFWEAQLDGMLEGYTEVDGVVTPLSGDTALGRDLQQLIIMYTGITVLRQKLIDLETVFRAKAGSVEYEVQHSAQVAKALLDEFSARRKYILGRMADANGATSVFYFDTYLARQDAINRGLTDFVGS